jgi:WD40 repeat protein
MTKKIQISILSLSLVLLSGCLLASCSNYQSGPAVSPTPAFTTTATNTLSATPTATSTSTPHPTPFYTSTPTAIPTATAVPPTATATAYPTLSAQGPYLVFKSHTTDYLERFTILDPDGQGRKVIILPENSSTYNSYDLKAISPDGEWLAFHTGTRDSTLFLILLYLPDGTVHPITQIMSPDYEKRLAEIVKKLTIISPEQFPPNEVWTANLPMVFREHIQAVAWSPDGRYLAFAGMIDGQSSDVYLFDTKTGITKRLTDNNLPVYTISWSPDGMWVIYRNAIPGNVYQGATFQAVKLGNPQKAAKPKPLINSFWWNLGDWLDPKKILMFNTWDTACCGDLRSMNIETGQIKPLWKDGFDDYAIDPENKIIAVNISPEGYSNPKLKPGLYFVTYDGVYKQVSSNGYLRFSFHASKSARFVGSDGKGNVYAVALDGSRTLLCSREEAHYTIALDDQWMAVFDKSGADLITTDNQIVRTFPISDISTILFRPDSKGAFIVANQQLYYLSLPAGELKLVSECEPKDCWFDAYHNTWIP